MESRSRGFGPWPKDREKEGTRILEDREKEGTRITGDTFKGHR
jgi:hypothetical protein